MNIRYNLIYSLLKLTALVLFIVLMWMKGYDRIAAMVCLAVFLIKLFFSKYSFGKNEFSPKDAVVITGCDSGLGFGLALHCHSMGAVVFAGVHNRHSVGAEKLKKMRIPIFPLEITSQSSVDMFCEIVSRMIEEHDLQLKAVVNNAAVMVFGEFEWQTKNQIADQINVNLIGTMRVVQSFLPLSRYHKSRIIIVCSHCSLESLPGISLYGATKAGLLAFATSLRVELKKFNVPVITFIPGSFVMESNLMATQKNHFQEMRQNMSDEVRKCYGEYFDRYVQYLLPLAKTNEPVKLSNENVFRTFEDCIFDENPNPIYKCEPWRYKWYHFLCKITPTSLRDILIQQFVNTPKWERKAT